MAARNSDWVRWTLLVLGIVITAPSRAQADAALYIDGNQGDKWGWAVDYPTISQAMARSKKECGDKCEVVMSFRDGCGAWAVDRVPNSSAWGWARGTTANEVKSKAVAYCRERAGPSGDCAVRVWGCNSREQSSLATYGKDTRLVLASLILLTTHKYSTSDFSHRSVHYCGYTRVTLDEAAEYGETIERVPNSWLSTGGDIYGHFLVTEGSSLRYFEVGRLDASPITRRLLEAVKGDRYFSDRLVREPEGLGKGRFATNGYQHSMGDDTNPPNYEVLYHGVQMILPSEAEYEKYRHIICTLPVERFPGLNMDAVDIGQF